MLKAIPAPQAGWWETYRPAVPRLQQDWVELPDPVARVFPSVILGRDRECVSTNVGTTAFQHYWLRKGEAGEDEEHTDLSSRRLSCR